MYIKQISAFIENSHGRLTDFTDILGAEGVDLIALSIADTTNFGILRAIVADSEKAIKAIRERALPPTSPKFWPLPCRTFPVVLPAFWRCCVTTISPSSISIPSSARWVTMPSSSSA